MVWWICLIVTFKMAAALFCWQLYYTVNIQLKTLPPEVDDKMDINGTKLPYFTTFLIEVQSLSSNRLDFWQIFIVCMSRVSHRLENKSQMFIIIIIIEF